MLEFSFIEGILGHEVSHALREEIFAKELLWETVTDDLEGKSYHFVGYDKLLQISVARMTEIDNKTVEISYIGVKNGYRGEFIGDLIMRALADKAYSLGKRTAIVKSPENVKGFFEFEGYGEIGKENGYIIMKKDLTEVQPCKGCTK